MDIFKKLETGKETVALRLYTQPEQYGTGTTIHVDVVYVKDENQQYGQSMGFYHNYYDEKHQYAGLSVTALSYPEHPNPSGYEIQVEARATTAITLDKAMEIAAVLKPINRKMVKLDDKIGQAANFSEYVSRFAKAINAKAFYHKSTTSKNDVTEYRVDNILDLKQAIDHMVAFNIQSHQAA